MQKTLSKTAVASALQRHGFSQAELARQLGVSAQAVSNWIKGDDFPRPDKLLRLAMLLRLKFDELVTQDDENAPIVAFRKRGSAKTTERHLEHARGMGEMLRAVVPYLPPRPFIRPRLDSATTDYAALQRTVSEVRTRLGLVDRAVLHYYHLIGQFKQAGTVLVPVLWGAKQRHENALHIALPADSVTFVFLNLDTGFDDFKFWMAHELAHVYTPHLTGKDEGEDFADAFAGALLFPEACAVEAYADAVRAKRDTTAIGALQKHADSHAISLYSVFCEARKYQRHYKLPAMQIDEAALKKARAAVGSHLVSDALFDLPPPSPKDYVAAAEETFQSDFFAALRTMVREEGFGPSFVRQVLDVSLIDGKALHAELSR
ncbi:helix-turn-helix transcriptional regulator [Cupriavidus plantarum]|uniref:helix-turn-helix transcriptional regulator n=1 Tax=Cupriavidus plantarum TaxID=942865 RepID=UPI000E277E33|nr:helix-turn-helix transcriptional regulator [Cupriavidus plantarum]REE92545.1 DNA-binding XRE family transcriptional regulator [Cupriavidus plantarum]